MSDADEAELVRESGRLLSAILGRDRAVLEELLDPEFAHVDAANQRTGRAEFIGTILGSTYRVIDAGFETISVERVGPVAVVTGIQRAEVELEGGQKVESRGVFTDIFVRAGSGWRIRFAHSVDLQEPLARDLR